MHSLFELQNKTGRISKESFFELSEKDSFDFEHLGTEADIEENELLFNTITNFQICKTFKIQQSLQFSR